MKRILYCILAFCLLFSACSPVESLENPCNFYYVRREFTVGEEDSVVAPQAREVKGLSLQELISAYLTGPGGSDLVSPFPAGTRLLAVTQTEESLAITLSDSFSSLSGVELSLACVCLAKTCLEYTQVNYVEICCETLKIGGNDSVVLDTQSVSLNDTYQPVEKLTETTQP